MAEILRGTDRAGHQERGIRCTTIPPTVILRCHQFLEVVSKVIEIPDNAPTTSLEKINGPILRSFERHDFLEAIV